VLLDGLDGAVLWKSEAQPGADRIDCLDEDSLLLSFSDFRSQLYRASSPDQPVVLRGSDALKSLGFSQDCLTLKTDDGESNSYTLPSGSPSDCRVRGLTRRGAVPSNHLRLTSKSAGDEHSGANVTLNKRAKGSPVLTVQLRDNGGNEWTRTLPFVAPTFSSAVALAPAQVLVWGATPGNRADVVLIALDRSTGKQAYTVPFTQPGASALNLFGWSGKHVLVGFMGGIHAIEPSTGETQWTKGSTGMGGVIVPSQFRDL
jgi:outer membrane protein assembly factor BamB